MSELLAHAGTYGVVTTVSRASGVPRQTLHDWRAQGRVALEQAFTPPAPPAPRPPALERALLTVLVAGHASYRGIQACLHELLGLHVSLATICDVVQEAGRRALACLGRQVPPDPRPLALDELYGNDRQGAYLSAVDATSGAVWATVGPIAPDAASWTLVLWELQAQGVRWASTIHDGGAATGAACAAVDPGGVHARDLWHVLARCAAVAQGAPRPGGPRGD